MNQSFISEITKKLKDERGVKDKELDADRKEKHMEEKFKPEDSRYLASSWNWWWVHLERQAGSWTGW